MHLGANTRKAAPAFGQIMLVSFTGRGPPEPAAPGAWLAPPAAQFWVGLGGRDCGELGRGRQARQAQGQAQRQAPQGQSPGASSSQPGPQGGHSRDLCREGNALPCPCKEPSRAAALSCSYRVLNFPLSVAPVMGKQGLSFPA